MRISDWSSDVCSSDLHSPDALDVLWLQLDQNRYRKDARGAFTGGKFPTEFTDGYKIASVAVEDAHGNKQPVKWVVSDTRMQVQLPTGLKANGGQLRLPIAWSYTVPGESGGRPDVNPSKNGEHFENTGKTAGRERGGTSV